MKYIVLLANILEEIAPLARWRPSAAATARTDHLQVGCGPAPYFSTVLHSTSTSTDIHLRLARNTLSSVFPGST